MLEWDAEDGGEGYWHVCGVCVDRMQSLELCWVFICLFLVFINIREIVLKLNRTYLYPVGPNPGLT